MKKTLIALGVLFTLAFGAQTSFAACPCSMGLPMGYASPCSPCSLTGHYSYPNVIGSAPCPCTDPCPGCSSHIILPRPNCNCGCQSMAPCGCAAPCAVAAPCGCGCAKPCGCGCAIAKPCCTGCAAPCAIAPSCGCGCGCATGFAAPGPCQNSNYSYRRGCNCDCCD